MTEAFERYSRIISLISSNGRRNRKLYQQSTASSRRHKYRNNPHFSGALNELIVTLTEECESMPYQGMDESCMNHSFLFYFILKYQFTDTLSITTETSGYLSMT